MGTQKILVSITEFKELAGIGERRVRQLCRIKGFPVIQVGNKNMIHYEAAKDWLAEYARQEVAKLDSVKYAKG